MFSWINDRFAQISNNSYKSRVTAVSLISQCKTLVEINFSTKSKWKDHKKNVQNLLNYLFGEKIENFIFEDIKDSFINFFEYQADNFEIFLMNELKDNRNCRRFLSNTYLLLLSLSETAIQEVRGSFKCSQLHHLIIIFLDFLILPDIFIREFKRSDNLKI